MSEKPDDDEESAKAWIGEEAWNVLIKKVKSSDIDDKKLAELSRLLLVTQEHGHELSKEGNNVVKMRKVLTWWWSEQEENFEKNGTKPTDKLIEVFKHPNISLPAVANQLTKVIEKKDSCHPSGRHQADTSPPTIPDSGSILRLSERGTPHFYKRQT